MSCLCSTCQSWTNEACFCPAVSAGCDCVVYQSYGLNDGRFTSPNFPAFYPPNTNCILYSFFGDSFEIIELTFLEFELRMPGPDG